jgi:hypothetical protein
MTLPDTLVAERHRDLGGRRGQPWWRRAIVALVAAIPLLAALNVFGQRPVTKTAASPAASLELYVPQRLRSGLIYEARFHISARTSLAHAALVLSSAWLEGMTVNTIEPAPAAETSEDGRLRLELGSIGAGRSYLLFVQFQVNPTNVGRRSASVSLYDGSARLVTLGRTVAIYP